MRLDANRVPIAYRAPFDFGGRCYVDERLPGESILDMVLSVPNLPPAFLQNGVVCINGEIVPRDYWAYVRPKPTCAQLPIAVTLHMPMQGGGGGGGRGGGKQIIAVVAAIALLVVTAALTGPFGASVVGALGLPATLGVGAFTVSTATLLAGAVGIAGALAISALTAPPTTAPSAEAATNDFNSDQAEAAAASGNVLSRGGAIPRVVGTRKCFPPFACEPLVELIGQDEYVEALYVLNGPHALSDIRIDGTTIADAEDVELETKEGWSSDTPVTLVTRQGRTLAPQLELSSTSVGSNGTDLANQSLPEGDLSVWHQVATRNEPDEIWMHLIFPGGISRGDTVVARVPLRIRFRQRDVGSPPSNWVNVPEVHVANNSVNQMRCAILFKWQAEETIATPPATNGFVYANLNVPPQTVTPATPTDREWDAHSYFDDGAGNDYLNSGNAASTRIRRLSLYDNRIEITMLEATFPKGIYEIEIKRGVGFQGTAFSDSAYTYNATVVDFFWYRTSGSTQIVPQSQAGYSTRVLLNRVASVWNEDPITQTGFAQIAIKALNRSVRQLSCTASGYVRDWDGSGWNTWTTTSNPAPHYADILCGDQNLDPLPIDLRDDDGLVEWRTLCSTNDWTCDSIINDTRTQDALNLLASCGYARPYQSDQYGVTVDSDRSGDTPIQIFSRRNSANMRYERAFARVPAGLTVTYRDETEDDDQAQITVYQRDPSYSDLTLLETVSYDGLIDAAKVEARAQFDLDQANLRSTFYTIDTDIESIVCRRGDLVGVEHDVLTSRAGDGYIYSKQLSGGSPIQITGITLDAEIPITNETEWFSLTDVFVVTDVFLVGITTGIVIRHTDGTLSSHTLSNVTGSTKVLTFATPFSDDATIQGFDDNDRKYGCLVVAGDLGSEYRRLLVQSIVPKEDLQATLVLVDEATDLVRYSP